VKTGHIERNFASHAEVSAGISKAAVKEAVLYRMEQQCPRPL